MSYTTKIFSDNLLTIEVARTWILMSKLFYLGLSILGISKIVMYGFLYCYMDTGSFLVCIKTEDIYIHIVKDVETKFNTSNYEWEWPLTKGKIKK